MLVEERRRQVEHLDLLVFDKLELAQTVNRISRAGQIKRELVSHYLRLVWSVS
jgi:hypothetical protein